MNHLWKLISLSLLLCIGCTGIQDGAIDLTKDTVERGWKEHGPALKAQIVAEVKQSVKDTWAKEGEDLKQRIADESFDLLEKNNARLKAYIHALIIDMGDELKEDLGNWLVKWIGEKGKVIEEKTDKNKDGIVDLKEGIDGIKEAVKNAPSGEGFLGPTTRDSILSIITLVIAGWMTSKGIIKMKPKTEEVKK